MKESFKETLEGYGHISKEIKSNTDVVESKRLGAELRTELEEATKRFETGGGTDNKTVQSEIYKIQGEKQKIMDKLKNDLIELDEVKDKWEKIPGTRGVYFGGKNLRIKNTHEILTQGEMLTDMDWGIKYNLCPPLSDPKLKKLAIPRNIRKKYMIEQAKLELQALLDLQIAKNEMNSGPLNENTGKKETYKKIAEGRDGLLPGLLAEKMVKNLIRKVAIDFGTDFEVERADVYQDVDQKIDFIIKRTARKRGVDVEGGNEKIGIQFTIKTGDYKLMAKAASAYISNQDESPVDDVVLVSIPLEGVKDMYDKWNKDKKSGGPDKLWSEDTRKMIFSEVMRGFLTPDEVSNYIEKMSKQEPALAA